MKNSLYLVTIFLGCMAYLLSSAAQPYTFLATVTWYATWAFVICLTVSVMVTLGGFFDSDIWSDGMDESQEAVCSYNWQEGGRELWVHQGASGTVAEHFFSQGTLSVKSYDKAVAVINQGPPTARPGEELYSTEVILKHGRVTKVVDHFYDLKKWESDCRRTDNLFSLFEQEFNGPPMVSRTRR